MIEAQIHLHKLVNTKLYYLPSYPFGEMVLTHLRQNYPDYEWLEAPDNLENQIVIADSNAFVSRPDTSIRHSKILLINPIWKRTSPEPVWLQIPVLKNSFLKRLARFKSSGFIDSYLHPKPNDLLKSKLLEVCKKPEVWHTLLKAKSNPRILKEQNNLYLLTNEDDPLRDTEKQNSLMQYRRTWVWKDFPHSLLASDATQRLELKQILQELTQDKGL